VWANKKSSLEKGRTRLGGGKKRGTDRKDQDIWEVECPSTKKNRKTGKKGRTGGGKGESRRTPLGGGPRSGKIGGSGLTYHKRGS